jgi:NAD(P)H-flavin reductase
MLKKLEKPINMELMERMEISNDTFVYRFAVPGRESILGHHTCQYLEFEADVNTNP